MRPASALIALATRSQALLAVKGDFTWDLAAPGLYAVTMVILFVAYLLLGFVYVVRFALLVVLTILAPAAALLFVLPETHHYTRLWASLFISTLLMQPLQLLILAIGFGLDRYGHVPVRHLFALASVYIVFKVPGALHTTSLVAGRASSKALALMSMDALMNRFTARAQFLPSGTITNLDRFECEASHMAERLSQRSH